MIGLLLPCWVRSLVIGLLAMLGKEPSDWSSPGHVG